MIDTLAEACYANGRLAEAVSHEKKALGLAPNREDLQKQMKKFEDALKKK